MPISGSCNKLHQQERPIKHPDSSDIVAKFVLENEEGGFLVIAMTESAPEEQPTLYEEGGHEADIHSNDLQALTKETKLYSRKIRP